MSQFTVNEQTYDVQDTYGAGHVLTGEEAKALNGLRTQKIASAWGQRIRQSAKRGTQFDATQAALEQFASSYKLGEDNRARVEKDPIVAEARKVVREALVRQLRENGRKISDLSTEQVNAFIDQHVGREDILAIARERVSAKPTGLAFDDLPEAPAEPEQPAQPEQYGPPAPDETQSAEGQRQRRRNRDA